MKRTMMMLTMVFIVTLTVNGATNGVNDNSTVQKIVEVTADKVNVRKQANQKSQRVGSVQRNQSLIVIGDWSFFIQKQEH